MLQNLQNFAKFQKIQLDNLVDFEKCCKMRIYLQRSAPIQPKTSEMLPKFCQKIATTARAPGGRPPRRAGPPTGCDGRVSLPRSRTTRNVHHTSHFLPLLIGRHCANFQSGLRKESRLTIHTNRLFSIQKAAAARLAKQIEKIK